MIVDVTLYIATIDMVSFYTSACYISIKIILKINFIKVNCINFTFMLIEIGVNNPIHDARRNEFVFLYFEQTVINLDIFI